MKHKTNVAVLTAISTVVIVIQSSMVFGQAPCLARPLISATRCETPPGNDGKLDDAGWAQTGCS